jgi:hypothetical protein
MIVFDGMEPFVPNLKNESARTESQREREGQKFCGIRGTGVQE